MDTIQRIYNIKDILMCYFQVPYLNYIISLKQYHLPLSHIC